MLTIGEVCATILDH